MLTFERANAMVSEAAKRPGQWPVWARVIARQRAPGDRGIGDTAEHVHGLLGTDGFALWYWAVFGKAPRLNCPAELNRLYGYVQDG